MKTKEYPNINTTKKRVKFVTFRKNGLIINDTPFFSLIISGFEKECRKHNAEMLMISINQQDLDFKQQLRRLKEDTGAGIAILATELSDKDMELFAGFQSPIVLLDNVDDNMNFNSVSILNEDTAKKAVAELIKNGHRKIGYLKGSFRIKAFQEREQGVTKQLQISGLTLNPNYVVELPTTMEGACIEMDKYLDTHHQLPTAYFADNDIIALGAMKAMQKHGINIPQQISIIGVDDLPFTEFCIPTLTSLKIPKQEMGKMAAMKLLSMLDQEEHSVFRIQTASELIKRESVKTIQTKRGIN